METIPKEPQAQLDKKDAETLARNFNKCFGHATMYGVRHQMSVDSLKMFSGVLTAVLETYPLINVTLEHESIVFEGWNVDKIVNAKKLASHFKKANLQSFSFEKGLTQGDLEAFLDITSNIGRYPTADDMKAELTVRGVKGIRLNYIMYRKMTSDEAVIDKGALAGLPASRLSPNHDPGDSFSLTKVLANPKAAAGGVEALGGNSRG